MLACLLPICNPYHPCELLLVPNMPVLLLVNICLDLFGVEGLEVESPACSSTASYRP